MSLQLLAMVVAGVFSAVQLRFTSWRALLFLNPSRVTVEAEVPADQWHLPPPLRSMAKELEALGFRALGSHSERASLAPEFLAYDFASDTVKAFATLYERRWSAPRLYFITPTKGGGFVITANYRRLPRSVPQRYLADGLAHVPVDRLLKMHQRRLEGFEPEGTYSHEARLEAARSWYRGHGRWEIRWASVGGLLSTLLSATLFTLATLSAFAMLVHR